MLIIESTVGVYYLLFVLLFVTISPTRRYICIPRLFFQVFTHFVFGYYFFLLLIFPDFVSFFILIFRFFLFLYLYS